MILTKRKALFGGYHSSTDELWGSFGLPDEGGETWSESGYNFREQDE